MARSVASTNAFELDDHLSKLAPHFCVPPRLGEVRPNQVKHLPVALGERPAASIEGHADHERRVCRQGDGQLILRTDQSEGLGVKIKPMELIATQEV
jgi:hypothetical protein